MLFVAHRTAMSTAHFCLPAVMSRHCTTTGSLLLLLLTAAAAAAAAASAAPAQQPVVCDCDLENNLHFVNLLSRVQEHSVPDTFTIDVTSICKRECVVFGRLPSTPDSVHQGSWSIDRDGTITFDHRPHKTGVAVLNITAEEASSSSNYTAHTAYRVAIEEDPDHPMVFASQAGLATELEDFDEAGATEQFRNATFAVEQNTGNNTAYADLLVTAGAFDYDADEDIRVAVLAEAPPRLGQLVGDCLNASSSARLLAPLDCQLESSEERLRNRSLERWDVSLPAWHPCNLSLPYPPGELSWFAHLLHYRPGLGQAGQDRFALTYTDKYRLQARLFVRVHILHNPCVNGGRCWGPSWDPDCTSNERSSGFFPNGYLCQCEPGWVGDRCEIDFDDCSSSPCPSPFVCVDKFRGYECICPENLARCQPILRPWQLSAVILGVVAVACAVAAVLIVASQRSPVVLSLPKTSPEEAPQQSPAEAAEEAEESFSGSAVELAEPTVLAASTVPAVVTFAEAEVQSDAVAAWQPSPSPSPRSSRRPPNPEPADNAYMRSFQRGTVLVSRPRQFLPDAPPLQEPPAASDHDDDDEVIARGGGAGSPSDAWRLRELRQALRNRQTLDDF